MTKRSVWTVGVLMFAAATGCGEDRNVGREPLTAERCTRHEECDPGFLCRFGECINANPSSNKDASVRPNPPPPSTPSRDASVDGLDAGSTNRDPEIRNLSVQWISSAPSGQQTRDEYRLTFILDNPSSLSIDRITRFEVSGGQGRAALNSPCSYVDWTPGPNGLSPVREINVAWVHGAGASGAWFSVPHCDNQPLAPFPSPVNPTEMTLAISGLMIDARDWTVSASAPVQDRR